MKKFIKIVQFILYLIILNLPIFSDTKPEEIALVSFITGKATVKSIDSKDSKPIKVNDRIISGDLIQTQTASKVTILYKGSEFKIAPNASVVIKELFDKNKSGKVIVNSGFAWFKLINLKGSRFEVSTPASTAGVRGTSFATMYDPELKQAMNCICEGKVEIQSSEKGSKPEFVHQGKGSAIDLGMKEIAKADYKDEIEKGTKKSPGNSLPLFEKRIQKAPLMKSCVSCHIPKNWSLEKPQEEPRDEVY